MVWASRSDDEDDGREADGSEVVDVDHDDLVAYLDGELSADETDRLEQRLASEAPLRNRLAALQQSWELLDALPRAQTEENFTRSTLEMVALTVRDDLESRNRSAGREARNRWFVGVALATTAALFGFGAVRYRLDGTNRELIEDLPVIDRVDLYRNVGEIDFLVRLSEEGLFDEPLADQN